MFYEKLVAQFPTSSRYWRMYIEQEVLLAAAILFVTHCVEFLSLLLPAGMCVIFNPLLTSTLLLMEHKNVYCKPIDLKFERTSEFCRFDTFEKLSRVNNYFLNLQSLYSALLILLLDEASLLRRG